MGQGKRSETVGAVVYQHRGWCGCHWGWQKTFPMDLKCFQYSRPEELNFALHLSGVNPQHFD